ncbi:hypothetical protein FB566_0628 [Stackebrandtia endophytica]|uniref:Uncharacterized protein n=1 Tax=Stackebrandtia endophytica TaxID=1496996 RepID=A0A543ARI8_9ACTN|nr:hypothetical protein [Stackebrandtia endophytica]TQL75135.1 hypothetical protein FB566_0628 [Stackebrandtia endophytica]
MPDPTDEIFAELERSARRGDDAPVYPDDYDTSRQTTPEELAAMNQEAWDQYLEDLQFMGAQSTFGLQAAMMMRALRRNR